MEEVPGSGPEAHQGPRSVDCLWNVARWNEERNVKSEEALHWGRLKMGNIDLKVSFVKTEIPEVDFLKVEFVTCS